MLANKEPHASCSLCGREAFIMIIMEDVLNLYYDWAKSLGLTRVSNVSNFVSTGVYVAMAVRPFSKTLTVHQGKGLTLVEAQISALGESIETALASESYKRNVVMDSTIKTLLSVPKTTQCSNASGGLSVHVKEDLAIRHGLEEIIERPLARDFLANFTAKRLINERIINIFLTEKNINWKIFSDLSFYELDDPILHTVVVLASVKDDIRGKIWFVGFGSRCIFLDACLAAITEAIQTYVTYIVGMRDDLPILTQENIAQRVSVTTTFPDLKKIPKSKEANKESILNSLKNSGRHIAIEKIGTYAAYGLEGIAIKCIER